MIIATVLIILAVITAFLFYNGNRFPDGAKATPLSIELNNDGRDSFRIMPSEGEYYVIERINAGTSTSRQATSNLLYTKKSG